MRYGKLLSYLGAWFFVVYGVLFSFIPYEVAAFVTDATPSSSSAAIDMRATYGGMSVAIGLIIYLLARDANTVRFAVIGLMMLMLCMATARILGIIADGDPNSLMWIYLGLEVVMASLCGLCLNLVKRRDA